MRTIAEIEDDLRAAQQQCRDLDKELRGARLEKFLRDSGVPEGARPVFANRKGERVLVDDFDGSYFPMGNLIKKDGTVSSGTVRRLYLGDGYHYVGE